MILLLAERGLDDSEPALLMMVRAQREGDPWSGDVSFPGGRQDANDATTRAAALRELQEETGFEASGQAVPVCRLSDLLTREHGRMRPMIVSPYVYRTAQATRLEPGIEAAELRWVPLSYLIDPTRRKKHTWRIGRFRLPAPAIDLGGARLWGLSLMMTRELLRAAGVKMQR